MKAKDFSARVLYAVAAAVVGCALGFYGTLKFLIRFGAVFHDNHPSMQGFGYFVMSAASGLISAIVFATLAITLPWSRLYKKKAIITRSIVSVALALLLFLFLAGQGNALVFVVVMEFWLVAGALLPFTRCGIID